MDGFWFGPPVLIEEIKSTYNTEELIKALAAAPHHPYKLQLRTYAYMHWKASGYEPELNLHVVNARSRQAQDIALAFDLPDYEAWLQRRSTELGAGAKNLRSTRPPTKKTGHGICLSLSRAAARST